MVCMYVFTDPEWDDFASKLLLDKYNDYIANVGPFKKFKNKKSMWEKISSDILETLNIEKTDKQCENRFKTILKRKLKTVKENSESGGTRTKIEFEDELNKIKAKDDSIEPEVLMGVGNVIFNKKNKAEADDNPKNLKKRKEDIVQVLKEIFKEKESSKERRHKEKMELFEKCFGKKE